MALEEIGMTWVSESRGFGMIFSSFQQTENLGPRRKKANVNQE